MRGWFRSTLLVCGLASASVTAQAAWHQASSTHFVIYSDEEPAKLREFATRLEKFDKAVRVARRMTDHPPGEGNRLTVFVVANTGQVEKLIQQRGQGIAGFYVGRATGSVAFVPRRSGFGAKTDLDAETVFFHEYAHHLMLQNLDRPYPAWLVEGFAEFLSTADFVEDGSVRLGSPALHRAYGLFSDTQIPFEQLLAANYGKLNLELRESLYARGWLLTHYLTFEPSRRGQLDRYVEAIARGANPLASAKEAFGDLRTLDRNLSSYLRRRSLVSLRVSASSLAIGPIDVRPLAAGAAAVLPLRMQSKRGVDTKTAPALAAQVRRVAARYPDDPLVLVTLAEAEHDADFVDAAEAAADRALKINPQSTEAMIYKGRAILKRAEKNSERGSDWAAARRWFLAANKIDTEDPEPLMLFYESFVRQGIQPTANAISALHYASNLSPQDEGLRLTSTAQYLRDGKLAEAKRAITPIAYDPHGGAAAEAARRILDHIERGDAKAALKAGESEQPPGEPTDR